jgi:hypothetical protein
MKALWAVVFLSLFGAAFASWMENATVRIVDSEGKPIPDVWVVITYQKSNANLVSDGEEKGFTDLAGEFRASLENRVAQEFRPLGRYNISANTYFWSSSQVVEATNASEKLTIFRAPIKVDEVSVKVLDQAGLPVPGAVASTTSPFIARRSSDPSGTIRFYVAAGFALEGAVGYGPYSTSFRSEPGRREQIFFYIPVSLAGLNITVRDEAGKPLAGVSVRSSAGGQVLQTDSQGIVSYQNVQTQRFEVYAAYSGVYVKKTIISANPSTHELTIPRQLLIASVAQERVKENTVKLTVVVHDPASQGGQLEGNATVEYSAVGGPTASKSLIFVAPSSFVNDFEIDAPARAEAVIKIGDRELRHGFVINPFILPYYSAPVSPGGQINQTPGANGTAVSGWGGGGAATPNPLEDYLPIILPIGIAFFVVGVFFVYKTRVAAPKKEKEEKKEQLKPQNAKLDIGGQVTYYARCLVKFVRDIFKK